MRVKNNAAVVLKKCLLCACQHTQKHACKAAFNRLMKLRLTRKDYTNSLGGGAIISGLKLV